MTEDHLPKPLPAGTPSRAPSAAPEEVRFSDTLPPPPPVSRSTRPAPIEGTRPSPVASFRARPVESLAPPEQLASLPAAAGSLAELGGAGASIASLLPAAGDADTLVFPVPGELLMDLSNSTDLPLPKPLAPPSRAPETPAPPAAPSADSARAATARPSSLASRPHHASPRGPLGAVSHGSARFPLRAVESLPSQRPAVSIPARQRRRHVDLIGLAPRALAIVAWFAVGAAGTFYDRAHPVGYGLDALFGVRRSLAVVSSDLVVARALLMVTVLICVTGLGLNSMRMRRAGDRYNRSLIFLSFASVVVLIIDSLVMP